MIKISDVRLKESSDNSEKIRDAEKRKSSANETMEEAWERIYKMKNSDADVRKLNEVEKAMAAGEIGREPVPEGKKQGRFTKAEALRIWKTLEEIRSEERLRKMVEDMPDNYELITDESRFEEIVEELIAEDTIVFDVESTGVDIWKDKIVGHVLSATSTDMHYYIPTGHRDPRPQLGDKYVLDKLRSLYEDDSINKVAHNAKYDMQMLNRAGINVKGKLWDTQEAMKLLNENEMTYALKPLVSRYLGIESYGYADLFGKDVGFDEIELDTALAYAAKDGDVTWQLYEFQRRHMKQHGGILEYFEEVEMPLLPIISDMELAGYDMDLIFAKEYGDELRNEAEESMKVIRNNLGDINLNSPIQLKEAIENLIGKKIKNTDAKQTLKPLSKQWPTIAELLKYREKTKLLSTYVDALPDIIVPDTGRVHTRFHQNGTKTGRFSSGGGGSFNIQNQPEEARRMFVAPEGYYILNADFSAQEVRIIASLSKEEVLLQAFAEGKDSYATLASEFFGLPYEDCYKLPDGSDTEYRKQMKVVLLSSMYGASKYGLSGSLGISVDEAEQFRLDFFDKYRKIDAFIKETQDFAHKHGFVWIGDKQRKRRLPDARRNRRFIPWGKWNDPKYEESKKLNGRIGAAMRQGPNAKVQGLAALQTKETMVEMDRLCQAKGRGWRLFFSIHDELGLIVDEGISKEDIEDINRVMTQTYLLEGVDNATDIEIQRRWSDSITAEEFLAGKAVPRL